MFGLTIVKESVLEALQTELIDLRATVISNQALIRSLRDEIEGYKNPASGNADPVLITDTAESPLKQVKVKKTVKKTVKKATKKVVKKEEVKEETK